MAVVFANFSFDQADLNLNRLYSNAYDSGLLNNYYMTYNGITYTDLFYVDWYTGGSYFESVFGGPNISYSGSTIAGTVTGYLELYWNGSSYIETWGIEKIYVNANSLYRAAMTSSTSDDYTVINSALSSSDAFYLSNYADRAAGLSGGDVMFGYGGNDRLFGGNHNDRLFGGNHNDTLFGGKNNDLLKGEAGRDILQGDAGKDTLFGGGGADKFVFRKTTDSKVRASKADVIKDFQQGQDKIDLHYIDASTKLAGNNTFAFKGMNKFGTSAQGEIYFKKVNKAGVANDFTLVLVDTDNDRQAEMSIKLAGLYNLTADDFFL